MIQAGTRLVSRHAGEKPHPNLILTVITIKNCENGMINAVVQREGERAFSTSIDPAKYRIVTK